MTSHVIIIATIVPNDHIIIIIVIPWENKFQYYQNSLIENIVGYIRHTQESQGNIQCDHTHTHMYNTSEVDSADTDLYHFLCMLHNEHLVFALVFTDEHLVLTIPVGQVASLIGILTLPVMTHTYSSLDSRSSGSICANREGLELRLHLQELTQ